MASHNNELFVIDGHNDLAWEIRKTGDFDLSKHNLLEHQPQFHTDIARLLKGGVKAQFWSAYVSPATAKTGTAVRDTLEQIALIHTFIEKYPNHLALALTSDEIMLRIKQGKIASLIGVEGGHSIDNSIGVLRAFYKLGARYMTLTHNDTTDWADSATDEERHGGMTDFGYKVVKEMNRLGMMVDIAHVSWATMRDALDASKAPILSTHSCAYSVAESPRNIPDDILKDIAKSGGMVMTCFASSMVCPEGAKTSVHFYKTMQQAKSRFLHGPNPDEKAFRKYLLNWLRENPIPRGSLSDLANHIDHMVKVMGIDHVGVGSDFGGCLTLAEGIEDVSKYPQLSEELMKRGYSKDNIKKIYHENILRVFKSVEDIAKNYVE